VSVRKTRRKRRALALWAALCTLLSGCTDQFGFLPYARELEETALMQTMGVDAAGTGAVRVTASTAVPLDGDKPLVVGETAGTISGACLSMQAQGASYIFYGHVGQILLGEELGRRDIGPVLDYVLRDVEMRLETKLYLVQGDTAAGMIEQAAQEGSAPERLEAMEADGGLLSQSMTRTVEEVLEDLEENGCTYVPALRTGEEGDMTAAGYGLIKDGRLVGWAQGEAASGVNLLMGAVDADIIEVDLPQGGRAALRLVGAKSRVEPVWEGARLTGVAIRCKVEANLAEGSRTDLSQADVRGELEKRLEHRTGQRIQAAADLCREYGGDFFQMENRAGWSAPLNWTRLQEQWEIGELPVTVEVQAHIRRGYDAV